MSYSHVILNLISYIESMQYRCVTRTLFTDTSNVYGVAVITTQIISRQILDFIFM